MKFAMVTTLTLGHGHIFGPIGHQDICPGWSCDIIYFGMRAYTLDVLVILFGIIKRLIDNELINRILIVETPEGAGKEGLGSKTQNLILELWALYSILCEFRNRSLSCYRALVALRCTWYLWLCAYFRDNLCEMPPSIYLLEPGPTRSYWAERLPGSTSRNQVPEHRARSTSQKELRTLGTDLFELRTRGS